MTLALQIAMAALTMPHSVQDSPILMEEMNLCVSGSSCCGDLLIFGQNLM
jgi:hypothetical protein